MDVYLKQYLDSYQDVMEVQNRFSSDDRVVEFYASWTGCMDVKGYIYATPWLAKEDFRLRLDAVMDASTISRESVANLAEEERAAASATVECGESPLNFLPDRLAVIWEDDYVPLIPK